MQAFSRKALWVLVALLFASTAPVFAEEQSYAIEQIRSELGLDLEFLSCDDSAKPLLAISSMGQIDLEFVESVGPCKLYKTVTSTADSWRLVLIDGGGEVVIHDIPNEDESFLGLSSEVRSVLIFVGGLAAAMVGRILALILDPIYHSVKLMMKYRATKKFFASVSDSFDKDFAVSEDLCGVARGEFLTNFLLTTKLRKKIKNLISYIEDWKRNDLKPQDFRDRLSKL